MILKAELGIVKLRGIGTTSSRALLGLMVWLSALTAGAQVFSESFDGVTSPALPPGWVTSVAAGTDLWVTDAGTPDTAPNNAYVSGGPGSPVDTRLDSPPVWIATAAAQLTFRHQHVLAVDPGALNFCPCPVAFGSLGISIDGGAFQEIAGWSGQNTVPLAYTTAVVNLPAAAAGTSVVFRWRLFYPGPTPNTFSAGAWWVDTIRVCDGYPCDSVPLPRGLSVADGGNGVWEPGEMVELHPSYLNNDSSTLHPLGTATGLVGPGAPAGYTIDDGAADYGEISPGDEGGCASTGDCYSVSENSGVRQVPHWDAQFTESLDNGLAVTWALHIGGSFADTPSTNIFYRYIETLFHRGVTAGCGGENYCPDSSTTREQMAALLLKSRYGVAYVPPSAAGVFGDVPPTDPFAPWVERLYALGITAGCSTSPLLYCPDEPVLRRQMAVFLLRTLEGSAYVPPECTGVFLDVPCSSGFAAWIEEVFHREITAGCGVSLFCPDNVSKRGQIAVFLAKTFGLELYGP